MTGFSLYPPEVRFIVSCVPSRLLRRDWFPMGSSARWAKNVPPARFLNARSNPFGYYADQNKRHPKRVPPEVRFIVSCVPSRLLRRDWFPMGSSARWAKNVPPARFLNARSNPFGYYADQNKRHPKRVPFVLARPKGFEPPISGIGIRCVIQLRHGRIPRGFPRVYYYNTLFRKRQSV